MVTDEIRTARLLLRRWREDDREPFAALNADPEVMRFFPAPLTREQSDALVDRIEAHVQEHGFGLWALEADGRFAGFTGLQWTVLDHPGPELEVGWRLARWAWGRGWATEAGAAALQRGLAEVGRVVSVTSVHNEPSRQVMRRLGMTLERELDHPRVPEGSPLRRHVLYVAGGSQGRQPRDRSDSVRPEGGEPRLLEPGPPPRDDRQ